MIEIWKDIDGYNYQVSSLGNIRSKGKYVPYIGRNGKPCKRWAKPTVLKWSVGTSGYPTAHIYDDTPTRKTVMIHRLVAEYFLEPVEGKEFVNHIDGDKTNNKIDNLEWVDRSENQLHAIKLGLLVHSGENSNFSKLTEKEVIELIAARRHLKGKVTARQLSEKYGICEKYAASFGNLKKKWDHLKEKIENTNLEALAQQLCQRWGIVE